jgi:hypothetical protein
VNRVKRIVGRSRIGDVGVERQISKGHPWAFQNESPGAAGRVRTEASMLL